MKTSVVVFFFILTTIISHIASKSGFAKEYSNTKYISLIPESSPFISKQVYSKLSCLSTCLVESDCSLIVYNMINNRCDIYNLFPVVDEEFVSDSNTIVFTFDVIIKLSSSFVDTNWLLSRLNTTNMTKITPVAFARSVTMDSFGYLLTLEALNNRTYVNRYDRTTLVLIKRTPLPIDYTNSCILTYYKTMIFVSGPDNTIFIFNYVNFTWSGNITCGSDLNQPRNIVFMESLHLMIVTSYSNKKIVYFRMNSINNFTCLQAVSLLGGPQGLLRISDTFFSVSTYNSLSIYNYQYNGSTWIQSLFANISQSIPISSIRLANLQVDSIQRRWVTLANYGIIIYDQYGNFLGQLKIATDPFDIFIMTDYRIVIAQRGNPNLILYDPQVSLYN